MCSCKIQRSLTFPCQEVRKMINYSHLLTPLISWDREESNVISYTYKWFGNLQSSHLSPMETKSKFQEERDTKKTYGFIQGRSWLNLDEISKSFSKNSLNSRFPLVKIYHDDFLSSLLASRLRLFGSLAIKLCKPTHYLHWLYFWQDDFCKKKTSMSWRVANNQRPKNQVN